ncbi:MAG: cation-translocating P-type ATPase [Acidimicrobiia bacterium]
MAIDDLDLRGLTAAEAAARFSVNGPNELPMARKRSFGRQVLDVVSQPMLLLLLGAGTVNFWLSEPLDGSILLSFVVVVIAISTVQERKTENALAALRDLSAPRALVIRDGQRLRVAGRDVVCDDTVLLVEGDRVPADAVLIDSVNLAVDESALTGESVPVRKAKSTTVDMAMGAPGGEDTPWIFSGTLVVKGRGIAVVQRTGAGTELGRIGTALNAIEERSTPLQHEVNRLVTLLAVAGAVAAALVVLVYGATRGDWLEGTLVGIGTAMAMLPEEFPVVLTVFLALGASRLSRRGVLTRRSAVIEALGSATVVCVDKTGTLTMNRMVVEALMVGDRLHVVDGRGSDLPEEFHLLTEFAVLASPIDPFDPMDKAFREVGERYLSGTEHLHGNWQLVREYPLSEHLLALSHVWQSPDQSEYVIGAKGAPEAIADLCHFSPDEVATLTARVERAAAEGLRVLAVARARFGHRDDLPTEQHEFEFTYLGLVGLKDPVRDGVAAAVSECMSAGVRVVMITGDYSGTALAIAREVGIDVNGGCVTGPQLTAMTDAEAAARVRAVNVFARMVPDQKLRLIQALRSNGEVVAMTGDGVNDAPALRAADIGIAMGERGTDVAREAAALVITDDNFTSIVGAIRQGRGIFDNLRKAMAYILAVHVPIFGMSLLPAFVSSWPLVLLPVQIAFLELIIDPACSIMFESEPVDPQIMQQLPRGRREHLFTPRVFVISAVQGVVATVAVFAVFLWAMAGDGPDESVRSVTFATLVFGNLALILVNRSWRLTMWEAMRERQNKTLKWIFGGAVAALVGLLTVPQAREAFNFGPMRPLDWAVAVAAGFLGVVWFDANKLGVRSPISP